MVGRAPHTERGGRGMYLMNSDIYQNLAAKSPVFRHGECQDMADCCMIVRDFEIGSSKGELTIDKLAGGH